MAALGFGAIAFARPDVSLAALVALFGAYALVDGIVMLAVAPLLAGNRTSWWVALDGLLGVSAGVLTLLYPVATAVGLLTLLGGWLLVGGVFRIGLAIEMRKEIPNEWAAVLGGTLSIAAGVFTLARPVSSALAWVWVVGCYAVMYGFAMLAVSVKLHQLGATLHRARPIS